MAKSKKPVKAKAAKPVLKSAASKPKAKVVLKSAATKKPAAKVVAKAPPTKSKATASKAAVKPKAAAPNNAQVKAKPVVASAKPVVAKSAPPMPPKAVSVKATAAVAAKPLQKAKVEKAPKLDQPKAANAAAQSTTSWSESIRKALQEKSNQKGWPDRGNDWKNNQRAGLTINQRNKFG